MSNYIKLTFITDADNTVTLNVSNPSDELNQQQISDAMDAIIAANAIQTSKGSLKTKYSAELVTIDEVDLI